MRPEEVALRLKVASGHLEGVRHMVDQENYCVDIMKQVSAIQASLRRFRGSSCEIIRPPAFRTPSYRGRGMPSSTN